MKWGDLSDGHINDEECDTITGIPQVHYRLIIDALQVHYRYITCILQVYNKYTTGT